MKIVNAILFEPVGCLAEFPEEEFNEIALTLLPSETPAVRSGSEAYWNALKGMEQLDRELSSSERERIEGLEIQAIDRVDLYEDVGPSLSELNQMGVATLIGLFFVRQGGCAFHR